MKMVFDSYDEYQEFWNAAHSGILYWKKVYQMTQGKINMNVDGGPTHYTETEAIEKMAECAKILAKIEDSTHPEWNWETDTEEMVTGVEAYSGIITEALKKAEKIAEAG